MQNKSIDRRQN